MRNDKQDAISYTIEREFLSKITVKELLSRIIKSHMDIRAESEGKPT